MKKFSIVIPVYNESCCISNLLIEIENSLKDLYDYEIIIVNDSSTDNTLEILEKLKTQYKLIILTNKKNLGQSHSILKGVNKSIFETIVTMDGDGQNNPNDIPTLVDKYFSTNCDLVSGIRKIRQDSFVKIFSSKIANFVRSKYLNDDCKDTGCALKVFNRKTFLYFPFFNGIHRFLPALFKGYGKEVIFLDVDHRIRKGGKSKYGTLNRLFKGLKDMFYVKKIIKNKLI